MSRWGTFNGVTGDTASEMAQARTDARTEDIRRPGVKIDVMSEEEWQRRMAEGEKARRAEAAKQLKAYQEKHAGDAAIVAALLEVHNREVKQQRAYEGLLYKKVKAYHELPDDDNTPSSTWKAVYAEIARFLAAAMVSYHYQLDREKGTVRGPDVYRYHTGGFELDFPKGYSLQAYVEHRNVATSGDERDYFQALVDRKVGSILLFFSISLPIVGAMERCVRLTDEILFRSTFPFSWLRRWVIICRDWLAAAKRRLRLTRVCSSSSWMMT